MGCIQCLTKSKDVAVPGNESLDAKNTAEAHEPVRNPSSPLSVEEIQLRIECPKSS